MYTCIICVTGIINPLSPNFTKWSNTLKQFVGKLHTSCLSVFDYFVGLALIGLMNQWAFTNETEALSLVEFITIII